MMLSESSKAQMIEDLCEFIRIPSRSSPEGGEEGALQTVVASKMMQAGAWVRVFEADDIPAFRRHPLCSRPDRQYANRPTVVGEMGPEDAPALLVLAHSDTVQIKDPEAWTFDPFRGDVCDGKVRGVGASDDKWGVAAMLVIMRMLAACPDCLRKRVIFASTMDEENGIGNGTLLLMLAGIRAQSALYLDGTEMKVCVGNLGGSFLYLRPKSPIDPVDRSRYNVALQAACANASKLRAPTYDRQFFRENLRRNQAVILIEWEDENGPYFVVAFYTLPGDSRHEICQELETAVAVAMGEDLCRYSLSYHEPWFEPALISVDTPLVHHMAAAVHDVLGRAPVITTVSKQDAFVLTNHADIPTVSFGPTSRVSGPGAFHEPDECVSVEEAWAACRVAAAAVGRWLEA